MRVPAGRAVAARCRSTPGGDDEAQAFARALIERFEDVPVDAHRGQRRRLRLAPQGVRRAVRRRPGLARARAAPSPPRCATSASCWRRSGPVARSASRSAPASRTTTPVIWRTRRASAPQPRALLRSIPGLQLLRDPRRRPVLRQRRHLQPGPARGRRRDRRAQGRPTSEHAPDLMATGQPRLHAADARSRARAADLPAAHPIEILDAAIRGPRTAEGRPPPYCGTPGPGRPGAAPGPGRRRVLGLARWWAARARADRIPRSRLGRWRRSTAP